MKEAIGSPFLLRCRTYVLVCTVAGNALWQLLSLLLEARALTRLRL